MATFPQPLTDVQTLPPSPCPRCCQQQAQRAAPSPRVQALAHPLAADAHPGDDQLTSAHPDEEMYRDPESRKER